MKVAVYTICKNEEQHVDKFMSTCSEADYVVILDTGSTDNSVLRLRELGAIVHERTFDPWRFDEARNACLDLVPDDANMCFSIDLDEWPQPGWRKLAEDAWCPGVTRIRYSYQQEDASPFTHDKFHARHGYVWRHIIHETIYAVDGENYGWALNLILEHWPDHNKSRLSYLPLLYQEIEESPYNDHHYMWLICELLAQDDWDGAISWGLKTLDKFPLMWNIHRTICLGYIAHAYYNLSDFDNEFNYRMQACIESPQWRDPWYYLTDHLYKRQQWQKVIGVVEQLLSISEFLRVATASKEPWGAYPFMWAGVAAWKTNRRDDAASYFKRGMVIDPEHKQIAEAYGLFLSKTNPGS